MYYLVYESFSRKHLVIYLYYRSGFGFTATGDFTLFETVDSLLVASINNIVKNDLNRCFIMHNKNKKINVHKDIKIGGILKLSRKNKISKLL